MATIQNTINNSISLVTEHSSFKTWLKGRKLNDGDFIAINNSFLYREELETTKSTKYVVIKYHTNGNLREIYIAQNLDMKKPEFLQISDPNFDRSAILISDAIEEELNNLGQVIFALIGNIQDDCIQSE